MKLLIPAIFVTLIAMPVMLVVWLVMRNGIYFMTKKTSPDYEENRDRTTLYSPGKLW